jgi:predicted amidophosphoribosyltransferase
LETKHCHRIKKTEEQSGLAADERGKNLHNAFRVDSPFPYQHVAIFDDVMTTGQTVNALAKQLKKAGVKKVVVWGIARAILN